MEVSSHLSPRPFHPQVKSPWYPLDRRLGGPQSHSGRGGEEKNSQPRPGIEPWNTDHPSRSPALYRLSYQGPVKHFVTSWIFTVRSYLPLTQPPSWGTPLVGCPRLLIQHIRSYLPYLEVIPSIIIIIIIIIITTTHN
jgi:hypothetical protein